MPDSRRWQWLRPLSRSFLRDIVIALLGVAVLLGVVVHGANVQHNAVRAIRDAGGVVAYHWEWRNGHWIQQKGKLAASTARPWAPKWLVSALGPDYFGHIVMVNIALPEDHDALLRWIGNLEGLESLILRGAPPTDATIAHVRGLSVLRNLQINWEQEPRSVPISNKGLPQIVRLSNLEQLGLTQTQVDDQGIAQLKRLRRLEKLGLKGTPITDTGVSHLRSMTRLTFLDLSGTQITDRGLLHLRSLPRLETVHVLETRITAVGEAALRKALPTLQTVRR